MRILIFNWRDLAHPSAGGAEVYTHQVARHWVSLGHDVSLFCSAGPAMATEDERDGVRILRRGNWFTVYREARQWYSRDGHGQFDVVLDEVNTRPFLCPDFVTDVPVVALIHQVAREAWGFEFSKPVAFVGRRILEPRWLRRYRDIPTLTVSESSRQSLSSYGLRRVDVIPEGATPHGLAVLPQKEQVPTLAFVGRLAPNKRPDHAIRAFLLARQALGGSRLWVIGSGPMDDELRNQIPEGVTFFGWVSDERKFDLMARAHAVLVTSVREGWCLVVSEAASVGTPSIAYDVPGLVDSVPACGGVLVSSTPEAMASEIINTVPSWRDQPPVLPADTGTAPWSEVSEQILRHLTRWSDPTAKATCTSSQP